jgi:WhiB family redox-sensing transcriptional regulator
MTDISRLPGPQSDLWEWQLHGACRGKDTELFFHPEGERGPRRSNREASAKAVCATCPVLLQCRAHALAAREPYGVWGGLSEHEREAIIAGQILAADGLLVTRPRQRRDQGTPGHAPGALVARCEDGRAAGRSSRVRPAPPGSGPLPCTSRSTGPGSP